VRGGRKGKGKENVQEKETYLQARIYGWRRIKYDWMSAASYELNPPTTAEPFPPHETNSMGLNK